MSTVDDLTDVLEAYPEALDRISDAVHASNGMPPAERAAAIGATTATAITTEATGISLAVLNHFLDGVELAEIGQHYIDCFDWQGWRWPMGMWADQSSVNEDGREAMREDLLTVRDQYGFDYPDEEAVFAYLEDGGNDLGDEDAEVSALDIGRLWQRRYQDSFDSWEQIADSWLDDHDPEQLWEVLRGLAGDGQDEMFDELKNKLGRDVALGEEPVLHYIDRLGSHGDLLCLKRRDG